MRLPLSQKLCQFFLRLISPSFWMQLHFFLYSDLKNSPKPFAAIMLSLLVLNFFPISYSVLTSQYSATFRIHVTNSVYCSRAVSPTNTIRNRLHILETYLY